VPVLIVVLVVAVLSALYVIGTYNGLVKLRNRIENAWSQVDVQLQRRYDLIPNLVETVQGYAAHERGVFEAVAKARADAISSKGVAEQAVAENALTSALRSVFAVAEAHPELQADENFRALQEELSTTEGKIAYARQFYNDTVQGWNTRIETFPVLIVAGMMRAEKREYFEADDPSRGPVKVEFS
jgi:LemA protein